MSEVELSNSLASSLEHSWPLPTWVTIVVVAIVATYVVAIYRRESNSAHIVYRYVMAGCRVAAIVVLLGMLYGWTLQQYQTVPPQLVIAIDSSQSMAIIDNYGPRASPLAVRWATAVDGNGFRRIDLANGLLNNPRFGWLRQLESRYRLRIYAIGDSAVEVDGGQNINAEDESTRLGDCLRAILDRQRGQSTAAVVVVTDGVTNIGPSLSETANRARRYGIPLYVVGLGSDQPPRDAWIGNVVYDRASFVGDHLSFECQIHASGYAGRVANVTLTRLDSNEVVAAQQIALPADGEARTVQLAYRVMTAGEFDHALDLEAIEDDTDPENNRQELGVRVLEPTIRVLMASSTPSYEFRFLRDLLRRSTKISDPAQPAIELTTVLQDADVEYAARDESVLNVFPADPDALSRYDVLILGDLNPRQIGERALGNVAEFVTGEHGGGLAVLAGPRFMPQAFADTQLAGLLPFDVKSVKSGVARDHHVIPTEVGMASRQLQLRALRAESQQLWSAVPPLQWCVDVGEVAPPARVLAMAKPDSSDDSVPLFVSQFVGAGRVVFHTTDSTYAWSRHDGSDAFYARYWLQTIRYLGGARLLADERPYELTTDATHYGPEDAVTLRLQFHDPRMASETASVTIEGALGQRRQVDFARVGGRQGSFRATAPDLGPGEYHARLATPAVAATEHTARFSIAPPQAEEAAVVMNRQDLQLATRRSDGGFYTIRDAYRVPEELPPGEVVKLSAQPPRPIWNSPLLALLFVVLLTVEWVMRKRALLV